MSIYIKLLEIQNAIIGLGKDKKAHNYSYVTGDKLLGFIKPLMNDKKILLKQEILSIDNQRQDYGISGKKKVPIMGGYDEVDYGKPKSEILSKVMMRFTWVDAETGEKDENLFGANGQNGWDKGIGSALTYGERYFLLKYFHIATDEDDIDNPDSKKDNEEVKDLKQSQYEAVKVSKNITHINHFLDKFKMTPEQRAGLIKLKELL